MSERKHLCNSCGWKHTPFNKRPNRVKLHKCDKKEGTVLYCADYEEEDA